MGQRSGEPDTDEEQRGKGSKSRKREVSAQGQGVAPLLSFIDTEYIPNAGWFGRKRVTLCDGR